MGLPERSVARVCVGASSDRHPERALIDTQLASEKSIVAMYSGEVLGWMQSSRALTTLHNRPNSWRPYVEEPRSAAGYIRSSR